MADDERADRLAAVAVELVVRVRDDDPAAVHRWLSTVVADNDMMALAVILAAAVPDDRSWTDLTAWIAGPDTATERRRRQWRESQRRRRHAQGLWTSVDSGPESVETAVHNGSGVTGSLGRGAA